MPEQQARAACEKTGCSLRQYREGARAVVQLPDRRRIAVHVTRDVAWIVRTFGFIDLLIEVPVIESWDLIPLYEQGHGEFQPSDGIVTNTVLDALIQRVVTCDSLLDVVMRAKNGALDPVEDVNCRFDARKLRTGSTSHVQQPAAL